MATVSTEQRKRMECIYRQDVDEPYITHYHIKYILTDATTFTHYCTLLSRLAVLCMRVAALLGSFGIALFMPVAIVVLLLYLLTGATPA